MVMSEARAPYTLTPVEARELPGRILAALLECRARRERITGAQLARRFGYRNDRKVRVVIGQLILKGHLILSSVRAPHGYYLGETKTEIEAYIATEFSRIREQHARIKAIQANAARLYSDVAQLPLVLE
jgi:hypothetical protein